ncbi:MFS transporter [Amycolatopsis sp. CA-230715]|uniref:MFS transporter n=1 Tax=Amycolatopsis sp. CA-230715 TaxID=2745196 RepID=UPI001C029F4F|nr:MFS transporter [Amycolatopsis sp. CA-230715]QWF82541.1 Multidrug resistance protein MdtH [Amycolatopsis sp. CA-230715]
MDGRANTIVGMTAARLPGAFWVLFAGQLVNRIGNVVVAFLAFYLAARGLSPAGAAAVVAVFGAAGVLSQPVGGALADRFGARTTLVLGMLGTAACLALLGSATSLPWLLSGAAALGLVGDVYRPASAALLVAIVPPQERLRAFGLVYWAVNLGFPIAGAAGGLLASSGYWALFALDAVTCVLFAAVIAIGVPGDASPARRGGGGGGYRTALRDRSLLALTALTFGYVAVVNQSAVGVAFAVRDAGRGPATFAFVAIVNGAGIVVLQPLCARVLRRWRPMRVLAWSMLVIGVGMASTGFAATPAAFAVTVLVWTLGEAGTGGITSALAADLAPDGAQGRYQAVLGWGTGMAKLAATALGGALYTFAGPPALWTTCAAVGVLGCTAGFLFSDRIERRRHATEPVGPHRNQGEQPVHRHDDVRRGGQSRSR